MKPSNHRMTQLYRVPGLSRRIEGAGSQTLHLVPAERGKTRSGKVACRRCFVGLALMHEGVVSSPCP
jgi:hypothetical protein